MKAKHQQLISGVNFSLDDSVVPKHAERQSYNIGLTIFTACRFLFFHTGYQRTYGISSVSYFRQHLQ